MAKKRLILVRHAEAQLERYGENDRLRSITMDGFFEIESLRLKLQGRLGDVSLILCSSVKRSRQTLEGLRILFPASAEIIYEDSFYQGSSKLIWDRLKNVSDTHNGIVIIGHNPGISHFLRDIDPSFGNFPTCGVAICENQTPSWTFILPYSLKLTDFLRP